MEHKYSSFYSFCFYYIDYPLMAKLKNLISFHFSISRIISKKIDHILNKIKYLYFSDKSGLE